VLLSNLKMKTIVKSTTPNRLLSWVALILLGHSLLFRRDRGTLIREAIIYLSPDASSNKLGQVDRGRELILLDKTPNWLHVEALMGSLSRAIRRLCWTTTRRKDDQRLG